MIVAKWGATIIQVGGKVCVFVWFEREVIGSEVGNVRRPWPDPIPRLGLKWLKDNEKWL